MHEQTIRLFWKVWIVWMSSTINIIINNNKKMTNYSFKMGTFSFRFLENFCQLQLSVGGAKTTWLEVRSVAEKQS